ncbi:hypothetical protein BV112_00582B, partial [Haemophilus influenzae]
GGGEIILF